jgi:signal transduction histidine kinase
MTMSERPILERLREHSMIGAVPPAELEWLAAHGTLRRFKAGEYIVHQGQDAMDSMMLMLTGHAVVYVSKGRGRRKVAEWHGGEVTGVLPYSRIGVAVGDGVAEADSETWAVHRDQFPEMIRECPTVTAIMVHVMLDRARHFTRNDLRDEKLMALGKLAAGLAHELNNPASAMVRSAKALGDLLDEGEAAARALGGLSLTAQQVADVNATEVACLSAPVGTWSPIERSDREDALAEWIGAHGVDAGLAGSLVDTGVTVDLLERLAGAVPPGALDVTLRWIASRCAIRAVTEEVERTASRVFELVSAVKGFTHMDQSPAAQPVDVGRGLRDTIIVLRSKATSKSVSLTADVAAGLPPVQGVGAELNQIWANLVDNALDAVGTGGHVAVVARQERQRVVVEVADDGPGIPPDIRERIFDPFFTTKDVGKGTGLGLDIVRRTLERHDGEIDVESRPGRTVFRVRLPAEGMRSSGRWSRSSSRIQIEAEEASGA